MITSAAFAFFHFLAVFAIFGTVFVEWQTMSLTPTCVEARRIQLCDKWFGIFAGVVLVVGFLRVFYFEKGKAFYTSNRFFHAKLTLFVLVGLLSIYPTIRFLKWRAQTKQGLAPVVSAEEYKRIMIVLRVELVLLLGMALCASLMARAVGLSQRGLPLLSSGAPRARACVGRSCRTSVVTPTQTQLHRHVRSCRHPCRSSHTQLR